MNIRFQVKKEWKADIVLCPVFEAEALQNTHKDLLNLAPYLEIAPALLDFEPKLAKLCLVHGHPSHNLSRVLFIGLGKRKDFKVKTLLDAFATAMKKVKELRFTSLALEPSLFFSLEQIPNYEATFEALLGLLLGTYDFNIYKTNRTDPDFYDFDPLNLFILLSEEYVPDQLRALCSKAEISFEALKLARDLSNEPANKLRPAIFAQKAQDIAKKLDLTCTILDTQALIKESMQAFLSVGQGAEDASYLVCLEYKAKIKYEENIEQSKINNLLKKEPIILVGKGVCFDSGGISLKPSAGMDEMKTDMSGAAVVLAVMQAVAQLKPDQDVIALLALTENMPDAKSTRPGDIVTAYNGKTIEIVNTDAEGRLVLCDSLSYAQKYYTSSVIIDIATLTGACVVALGEKIAGLYSNDEQLAKDFMAISQKNNENYWQLPLAEQFNEAIKSEVADLVNAGSRMGGSVFAAVFLEQFIEKGRKWIHLDIAGPARANKSSPSCPKGGTGFGLRTILDFILNFKK